MKTKLRCQLLFAIAVLACSCAPAEAAESHTTVETLDSVQLLILRWSPLIAIGIGAAVLYLLNSISDKLTIDTNRTCNLLDDISKKLKALNETLNSINVTVNSFKLEVIELKKKASLASDSLPGSASTAKPPLLKN
ncbi:MAG TPA: hypothetical protein VGI75_08440 [Pirellulales bacterium]|jgi:hypothetical protein